MSNNLHLTPHDGTLLRDAQSCVCRSRDISYILGLSYAVASEEWVLYAIVGQASVFWIEKFATVVYRLQYCRAAHHLFGHYCPPFVRSRMTSISQTAFLTSMILDENCCDAFPASQYIYMVHRASGSNIRGGMSIHTRCGMDAHLHYIVDLSPHKTWSPS